MDSGDKAISIVFFKIVFYFYFSDSYKLYDIQQIKRLLLYPQTVKELTSKNKWQAFKSRNKIRKKKKRIYGITCLGDSQLHFLSQFLCLYKLTSISLCSFYIFLYIDNTRSIFLDIP